METIIKEGRNYELRLRVTPVDYWPGQKSVELIQRFPDAQRPRDQRLVQVTLDDHSAQAFANALTR